MSQPVAPRNVVLNLVRVSPQPAVSIRQLLKIGGLFAFTPNAVRVAVTRLVADASKRERSYSLPF